MVDNEMVMLVRKWLNANVCQLKLTGFPMCCFTLKSVPMFNKCWICQIFHVSCYQTLTHSLEQWSLAWLPVLTLMSSPLAPDRKVNSYTFHVKVIWHMLLEISISEEEKKTTTWRVAVKLGEVLAMMWLSLVTKGQSPSWKESKHIDSWIHCLLCGLQSEFTQHLIVHIQQGIKTYRDC